MSLPDARPPMQAEEAGIAGLKGDAMLTKCCHPECHAPFDFREGRLIRFSRGISNGQSAESQRLIEHFGSAENVRRSLCLNVNRECA
jgi:hypothetical protein